MSIIARDCRTRAGNSGVTSRRREGFPSLVTGLDFESEQKKCAISSVAFIQLKALQRAIAVRFIKRNSYESDSD
jgi:hypothetical protein